MPSDSSVDELTVLKTNEGTPDTCASCGMNFTKDETAVPVWHKRPEGEPDSYLHEYCAEEAVGYSPSRIVIWESSRVTFKEAFVEKFQEMDTDDLFFLGMIFILFVLSIVLVMVA